jgi:hypothetical protein
MSQNYPPRPSIIWTRRVLVLLILGGLVWGAVAAVSAGISFVSGIFNPSKTPVLVAGSDCQPQQIQVKAFVGTSGKIEKLSFAVDEKPYFWFSITNTASVECKFNVGTNATFFTITSGNDHIWSSKDCNLDAARTDTIMSLAPNKTVVAPADYWDRVRSSSAGCALKDGLPSVTAGGASYYLSAEVNGVISENSPQFVLN